MKRPAFLFRPNMRRKDHQAAWELLNAQAVGNKADYIVDAIMQAENKPVTEDILRKIIREELLGLNFNLKTTDSPIVIEQPVETDNNQSVPDTMLDFLNGLDI